MFLTKNLEKSRLSLFKNSQQYPTVSDHSLTHQYNQSGLRHQLHIKMKSYVPPTLRHKPTHL